MAGFCSIQMVRKTPLKSDTAEIDWNAIFGRVEVRSWIEWRGYGTAVGMGSKTVYDAAGRLISHDVEPTGAVLIL